MSIIATNVLSWSDDNDGLDPEETAAPFYVELDPKSPVVDQKYSVRVYASDPLLYSVTVVGAGKTTSSWITTSNGIDISDEESSMSGDGISTKYPVGSISQIKTVSGIFDQWSRTWVLTPGSIVPKSAYQIKNGAIVISDSEEYENAVGSIIIDYKTTGYRSFHGYIAGVGTAFIIGHRGSYLVSEGGSPYQTIELTLESDVAAQTITVRECTTDEPIAGAIVTFLGETYTTDVNGFVSLGIHEAGQTIPITITATGQEDYEGFIST